MMQPERIIEISIKRLGEMLHEKQREVMALRAAIDIMRGVWEKQRTQPTERTD